MFDLHSLQADEVEALSSIYGDQWKVIDPCQRKYSATVKHSSEQHSDSICLQVHFGSFYYYNNCKTLADIY